MCERQSRQRHESAPQCAQRTLTKIRQTTTEARHAAQDFYPVSQISLQASQKVHVFIGTPVPHATRPHRICVPTLARSLVVPCCVIVAVSGWCREGVGLSVRRLINTTTIDSHTPRRVKLLFFFFGGRGGEAGRFFYLAKVAMIRRKI